MSTLTKNSYLKGFKTSLTTQCKIRMVINRTLNAQIKNKKQNTKLTSVPENWFGPSDGKTSKLFLDRVIDEQFLHANKNPG